MKYLYIDKSRFFQGLPAEDLNDKDLSEEQKKILEQAVAAGIYETEIKISKPKEKKDGDK